MVRFAQAVVGTRAARSHSFFFFFDDPILVFARELAIGRR